MDAAYQIEQFSKTQSEFDTFYEQELKPVAEKLEKERRKTLSLAKAQAMKCIIPLFIVILSFIFLESLAIIVLAGAVIYAIYVFKDVLAKRNEMPAKIKEHILTELITFLNPNFTYKPKSYVKRSQFVKANIYEHHPDRYSGDDLISGYVGNLASETDAAGNRGTKTDISFSEIVAEKVDRYRDDRGRVQTRVSTIFQGLFFVADFNKDFKGLTTVIPKQRKARIRLPDFFSNEREQRLQEVELEDVEFMDEFTVLTTDQIKARYILTPAFMRRLHDYASKSRVAVEETGPTQKPKSAQEAFQMAMNMNTGASRQGQEDQYRTAFSFRNGKMYFMLATGKNHFESGIFRPVNKALVQEFYEDINRALELVDELNLNMRIWTKD